MWTGLPPTKRVIPFSWTAHLSWELHTSPTMLHQEDRSTISFPASCDARQRINHQYSYTDCANKQVEGWRSNPQNWTRTYCCHLPGCELWRSCVNHKTGGTELKILCQVHICISSRHFAFCRSSIRVNNFCCWQHSLLVTFKNSPMNISFKGFYAKQTLNPLICML